MQIPHDLAMDIVKRLESIQPHEVVLTDKDGTIIGASNAQRIGSRHQGAQLRIQATREGCEQESIDYPSEGFPLGEGVCIRVENRIIGVIGLSCKEPSTRLFLEASKLIVEMMLERELLNRETNLRKKSLETILSSLISEQPESRQTLGWALDSWNIDVSVPRTLVLFEATPAEEENDKALLSTQWAKTVSTVATMAVDFFSGKDDLVLCNERRGQVIAFLAAQPGKREGGGRALSASQEFLRLLHESLHLRVQAAIGRECRQLEDYSGQYIRLNQQLMAGRILSPRQEIYSERAVLLGDLVVSMSDDTKALAVSRALGELVRGRQNENLLETLTALFQNNMNLQKTADALFIHRGTLRYRIQRISEVTGYDPRDVDGLTALRLAYLCYVQREGAAR